jgi:hypothetical protein
MSKLPSRLKMLGNFTLAVIKHAASGLKPVTEAQFLERMDACNTCPNLVIDDKGDGRCKLCGCWVESKGSWESQNCPDKPSRWPRIKVGESGKPLKLKNERKDDNPEAGN